MATAFYPTLTNDTLVTTARQLTTTAPSTNTGVTNKTAKSTGWGIIQSQGNSGPWAAGASQPAFGDLHGFILDDTTLEGSTLTAGACSGKLGVSTSSGTITGVLHWRVGVRHSDGTFTEFVDMASGSVSIGSTISDKAVSGTAAADVTLGVGDKLYAQVELQITANTSSSNTATTTLREISIGGVDTNFSVTVQTSTVYNDSGSGSFALSGSSTEAASSADSGSGTIALSGSGVELYQPSGAVYTDSGSGTLTLSGSRSESFSHSATASGTLTLSGSRTESLVLTDSSSGTISLSGSGSETFSGPTVYTDSASGSLTLSGSSTESFTSPTGADPIIIQKTGTAATAVMQKTKTGWTYVSQKAGVQTPIAQKVIAGWTEVSGH